MNIASAKFKELLALVKNGERPEPRTEAQEDQMAIEDLILLKEGAFALARYKREQRLKKKSLKLNELSPEDRAIIERERADQKDFPPPPKGDNYAPRPDGMENDIPIAWMRDH